ncbi:MAG: hypothetical protein M1335_05270 [Chloroflexi bacterium]|nr:hypothetical protein [Chloroflexota bacterium]
MPVVINEFEVVPQTQPAGSVPETGQVSPPQKPEAREIDKIVERNKERMLRILAH